MERPCDDFLPWLERFETFGLRGNRMRYLGIVSFVAAAAILSGCGGRTEAERQASLERQRQNLPTADEGERSSFFDLFADDNADQKIAVNRHLWAASLDVLSFLPIETVDPFSGVIATGWGRVNGASTPYRVTVYISQPALDARSLRVAVFRGGGTGVAVSDDVARQIEDSILTRARQMKMAENNRG
ncbi:DUF3576 domain-containing protein [Halovulum sp. GXIMD14793]